MDSIRTFDPETQRSLDKTDRIRMLPAREFPLNEEGIARFCRNYRNQFALVCHGQRIDTQYFTGALHILADLHLRMIENYAPPR